MQNDMGKTHEWGRLRNAYWMCATPDEPVQPGTIVLDYFKPCNEKVYVNVQYSMFEFDVHHNQVGIEVQCFGVRTKTWFQILRLGPYCNICHSRMKSFFSQINTEDYGRPYWFCGGQEYYDLFVQFVVYHMFH